jgi:hypothetical protein
MFVSTVGGNFPAETQRRRDQRREELRQRERGGSGIGAVGGELLIGDGFVHGGPSALRDSTGMGGQSEIEMGEVMGGEGDRILELEAMLIEAACALVPFATLRTVARWHSVS